MSWPFSMVALIPARVGSKRVSGKNMKLLAGRPITAYAIEAAKQSKVFTRVLICTDDDDVARLAYAPDVYWREPVADDQADIVWVSGALASLMLRPDAFAIVRHLHVGHARAVRDRIRWTAGSKHDTVLRDRVT